MTKTRMRRGLVAAAAGLLLTGCSAAGQDQNDGTTDRSGTESEVPAEDREAPPDNSGPEPGTDQGDTQDPD